MVKSTTIDEAGNGRYKDFFLNDTNTATAIAVVNSREGDVAVRRAAKTWKPSPCLLTRRELRALIAEQLG
ncbi:MULTISPECIES: hypothetical protein [unclassified Rhizobium]|uniref:hypothetical protein n=1 Tax=unclassified Rhizobium TaxID=2613769 RepID=UPI001A99DBBB|nr:MULTISPECIES: hypothetical protein [unclassified Rhizobium]MBX5156481.1 hypothetical protein [Rhizobium sp. NZLR8]MBX5162607.1 hypothetical protein [Rhizobium sp. NZLR4b]MBX5172433.1 hypothetical protein [Rhizobium sp. NZLR1b]MBX5182197.1 hypothetical protein [Rhizobium sp. NZLR5]MBX5187459.1 hypothetical protein [Rhizobium sp. NZLR3b]